MLVSLLFLPLAQGKNEAIEEITRKVVGTNVLSRYETKDKQVLRL